MISKEKLFLRKIALSYDKPLMKKQLFNICMIHMVMPYLDAYNNIPHVGIHPLVVEASQQQSAIFKYKY